MSAVLSKYKKMELRLDTYEKTHAQMEETARYARASHPPSHHCLIICYLVLLAAKYKPWKLK